MGIAWYQASDPCRGGVEYIEIGHGDHSHFRPCVYDPEVSLHSFPVRRPGAHEVILPDGRVVPRTQVQPQTFNTN